MVASGAMSDWLVGDEVEFGSGLALLKYGKLEPGQDPSGNYTVAEPSHPLNGNRCVGTCSHLVHEYIIRRHCGVTDLCLTPYEMSDTMRPKAR